MSGKVQALIHFFLHLNPQPVVVALLLAMPATRSQGPTLLPSPGGSNSRPLPASKGKAQDKVPLIRWDGSPAHAARTTRLLDWCTENEAARIKLFSDSTQDAREEGRSKVVAGHSKGSYLREAAKAIFANDGDAEVQHLSQVRPDLFEGKVLRRIKE